MKLIKGIISPIITPINEDESINEVELRNQIERLISAGVHGIFAFGTNGEGYILNKIEKETILKIVVEQVNHRVPVYAGTGCISTKETVELSVKAKEIGADVLSIITPWFAPVSQDELIMHYTEVAKNVDLPIVLYNIPARTGNALQPISVRKLAEIENIIGAKDSSGDLDNMLQYIEITRGMDFSVLAGNDSLILKNLMAGGAGGVAGCSNVFPENMVRIYTCFINGEYEKAKICQDNIKDFRNCFKFGNPNTIVKAAVEMLGYPVGKCRKPFSCISEEGKAAIKAVLYDYKMKGIQ